MTTMEDLTKTQIVLLTLLVSFITSIATGIITSSLLAQAPAGVTQTIDRVVERTVEKVSPTQPGATVKEVTIVKEGDAIVTAVENSNKSIVRILFPQGSDGTQAFYALGVIVNKQGLILSDKRDVSQAGSFTAVFSDGSSIPASRIKISDTSGMALFRLDTDEAKMKALTPIIFSQSNPKLGQTVVAVQGSDKPSIMVGRVLSLDSNAGTTQTDVLPSSELPGSPLLNLSGELVGLKSSNSDMTLPQSTYTLVSTLAKFVAGN